MRINNISEDEKLVLTWAAAVQGASTAAKRLMQLLLLTMTLQGEMSGGEHDELYGLWCIKGKERDKNSLPAQEDNHKQVASSEERVAAKLMEGRKQVR
jgi:uncharacterized protein YndB with AHSA1/START domain